MDTASVILAEESTTTTTTCLSFSDVFIMLINVKMPTIVDILTFMSRINFVLSWVEHGKSFITSGPGCRSTHGTERKITQTATRLQERQSKQQAHPPPPHTHTPTTTSPFPSARWLQNNNRRTAHKIFSLNRRNNNNRTTAPERAGAEPISTYDIHPQMSITCRGGGSRNTPQTKPSLRFHQRQSFK